MEPLIPTAPVGNPAAPVSAPETVKAAKTYDEDYVASLKNESKAYRQRAQAAEDALKATQTDKEARDRKAAEEQGNWQAIATQEKAARESAQAVAAKAKAHFLTSTLKAKLSAASVPSELLDLIQLPTQGLSVVAEFIIVGDLDGTIAALVAKLAPVIPKQAPVGAPGTVDSNSPAALLQRLYAPHPGNVIGELPSSAPTQPARATFNTLGASIAAELNKAGYSGKGE